MTTQDSEQKDRLIIFFSRVNYFLNWLFCAFGSFAVFFLIKSMIHSAN